MGSGASKASSNESVAPAAGEAPPPSPDARLPYNNYRELFTLKNYWKTVKRNAQTCSKQLFYKFLVDNAEYLCKYGKLQNLDLSNMEGTFESPKFEVQATGYLQVFDDVIAAVEANPADATDACNRLLAVGRAHKKVAGLGTSAFQAVEEKMLGNEAYKVKDFVTAHAHYDKAIELDPSNITYLTNKAAAYFEEGKLDECIGVCEKAVDVGRERQADFKLIAKAMARAANAFLKQHKYDDALSWFDKSLSEYRDPALVKRRQAVEKEKQQKERLEYLDPELAKAEKDKGNDCFKAGDYPGGVKHYTEALRRDPDNAIVHSNRAACYTKLMRFDMALADCEACIKRDSQFIKGHIRKGAALIALKEFHRAQRAFEDALQLDANNQEARDGFRTAVEQNEMSPTETREKALNDPEVQKILGDPVMRMILEQASQDPASLREHLKNPEIADKIMKLRDAGIVQTR